MKKFFKVFVVFLFCVFQCGNVDALSFKGVTNKEFRTKPYAEIYAYFEDCAFAVAIGIWDRFFKVTHFLNSMGIAPA